MDEFMAEALDDFSLIDNQFQSSTSLNDSPRKKPALKEQEQWMDGLKKENFSLKLRVHFLEETLNSIGSYDFDAVKQNVDLKIVTEQLKSQLAAKDKELQHALSHKERDRHTRKHSQPSSSVLEETVIGFRKNIESLEDELSKAKAHQFEMNSTLSQRAVEIEQLRSENESLRLLQQQRSSTPVHHHQHSYSRANMSRDNSFMVDGGKSSLFDTSFGDTLQNPPPPPHPSASVQVNHQLEQGINLFREQIGDLKMQLIEKSSTVDRLQHDIEARNQQHLRKLSQLQDEWKHDETKLRNGIAELKEQLARSKNENQQLTMQYEAIQRTHFAEESNLHMQIQDLDRNLQTKSEKLTDALQNVDKLSAQVKTLDSTLSLKTSHIEQLSRQLDSKNHLVQTAEKDHVRVIDQLNTKLLNLQREVSELNMSRSSRDTENQHLKDQIERQKESIAAAEERWSRQVKDVSQQQREVRQELEKQIQQFKAKSHSLSQSLEERNALVKELQTQLEMHSVGHEESMRSHAQEKERLRFELHSTETELQAVKRDLAQWQHRLGEIDLAYKDVVSKNDRLQITVDSMDEKAKRYSAELTERDHVIKQKDMDLRDKNRLVKELNDRLVASENAAAEGQEVVTVIERRFSRQVEERNQLLTKIQSFVLQFLKSNQNLHFDHDEMEHVSDNYVAFSEDLLDKLRKVNHFPALVDQKVRALESRMNDGLKVLNKKLERKLEQLEKFELIVRDAVAVQRKMRETLKVKHAELQQARVDNSSLQHQISILHHEMTTLKSESILTHSTEKARIMEREANLSEMDRQLKERDRKIRESDYRLSELQDTLSKQQQMSSHRINELNNHLRLLRQELEVSQKQSSQLEKMVHTNESGNPLTRKHSMQTLMEASDKALEKLNRQFETEVGTLRSEIERERKRSRTLEDNYGRLKDEYQSIKKRLAKREAMIEKALSKLELVSHRKDSLENNVLHQFTSEVKRMMTAEETQTTSLSSSTTSYQQQQPKAPAFPEF